MSLFDLSGKSAVITGSSRGIGKAIAYAMAEQGARVTISSRKPGPCEEVAADINAKFGDGAAIAVPANISSKEDLQNMVDETNAAFGKIDIVVCNAASNPYYGSLGGISDDQFQKILSNNIVSNNWLIQMALPQMVERKDGAVIIVSSIGGLKGSPIIGAYNISKAADFQLARNLCVEHAKDNIRVNCIAPGFIDTEMTRSTAERQGISPDDYTKMKAEKIAIGRVGVPEDVANVANFLASDEASFVNGQIIYVSGGPETRR